ncbi:DUF6197 family protein [Microbispora sp. ATCC PTA-5024]|uniref:DUF6197 family protein n=1 Tax=Microbispora sp. ATCC PTA-5024 TaxID=316330 RepID=UPI0003DD5D17|nr:hypothetical protein [Microbispora sp. ATCC PTA-5024]ETK36181.1 hypothetical protein MPTA5024_11180 [Microbispora sp. ATCC PTA-5024]
MSEHLTDPRPGILRKAVEVLQVNGRYIGDYYDLNQIDGDDDEPVHCRVCVLGAIALAAGCDLRNHSLGDPQTAAEDLAIDAARALAWELHLLTDREDPNTVINVVANWHDGVDSREGHPSDAAVISALSHVADALERVAGEAR